ncbi:hypothetical protein [Thalassotalea ganghwensis]
MRTSLSNFGLLGKVYTGFEVLYKTFYKNEKDANEAYKRIYPAIKVVVRQHGVKSPEARGMLLHLASFAPTGAKQRNFIKYYIDQPEGWKKLPADPKDIPYGKWY